MSSLSGHVDFSSFEPLHSRAKNSDPIFFFFGPGSVYIIFLNVHAYTMCYISTISPRTHRFYTCIYRYFICICIYIYIYKIGL